LVEQDQCVYWTFLGIPDWFLSRGLGWFPFAVIPQSVVDEAPHGLSSVSVVVFLKFFGTGVHQFNFQTTGVKLRSTNGQLQNLKATLDTIMQDYEAFVKMFCTKGASGVVPCLVCENVTKGRDVSGSAVLKDIRTAALADCKCHTKETMWKAVDDLAVFAADPDMFKYQFNDHEKARGFYHAPGSLLTNKPLRDVLDPADAIYLDWFHCLLASGGIATFHGNAFVRKMLELPGITLEVLDNFVASVQHCRNGQLPTDILQRIYNSQPDSGWKLQGSDNYLVIVALGAFVTMVLQPAGQLVEHCQCFLLLVTMLDIYYMADGALRFLDLLAASTAQHFTLCVKLYPGAFKPKLHFLHHIPRSMRKKRRNLNTLSAEKYHKWVRSYAKWAKGRHRERHAIHGLLLRHMTELSNPQNYMPIWVVKGSRAPVLTNLMRTLQLIPVDAEVEVKETGVCSARDA